MSGETLTRAVPDREKPLVSHGLRYTQACLGHVERLGCSRVYILAGGTLSRKTDLLRNLEAALGDRVVGTRVGLKPHTLMSECLDVLNEFIQLEADCIVTLGGGSLSDAAKIISFAEANRATTKEKLLALPHATMKNPPKATASRIPYILIPSTLSGGEYSQYSGVTDDDSHVKYQFGRLTPADVVILSGDVTVTTPLETWIASGVRAVDHCGEGLSSLIPRTERWPVIEDALVKALHCLVPGLLRTVQNPDDKDARLTCSIGVPLSLIPLAYGVMPGASHGIGHIMGPMGVVHGHTSCVLMPSVHKFNKRANAKEQAFACRTFWSIPEARKLFADKGLDEGAADLGDLLDCFVRALNMPRSLTEVGIVGDERVCELARNSMHDPCVDTNPVPITDPQQFYDILSTCR